LYLDGPFSSRILTPTVNSPIIIQHAKNRGNNISIISKYEIYQWITVNYDIKQWCKMNVSTPQA
jgi:hypothetical protein